MKYKYDDFYFTFATHSETKDKLFIVKHIRNVIQNNLNLKNYTSNIQNVFFTYLSFKPDSLIPKKEWKRHSRKKHTIELGLKLDYEKVLQANETEMLQMMAQLYLEAIKTYPNIRGKVKLSEFDYIRFYEDVEALFLEKGWVEKQHAVQTIN